MQSGFHFLLSLFLIRTLSTHDFGVFAITFVVGGVSLSYGNALISIPAAVHIGRLTQRRAIDHEDVQFGTVALVISLLTGAVTIFGMQLALGRAADSLSAGALIGLWTLRNHVRTMLFARRLQTAGLLSDFSYSVSAAILVAVLLWLRPSTSPVCDVVSGLAVANAIAICIAFRSAHIRPRVAFRRSVLDRYREIRRDIGWSVVNATTWNVQSQSLTFLVAAFAGPAAYAPVAAGAILFTPLRPAVWALVNVFRAEFAAGFAERRFGRLRYTLFTLCGLVALACFMAGGLVWLGWPYFSTHLFDSKFDDAGMPLIVGLSFLSVLIYLTYNVAVILIQAAGEFRQVALATAFGSVVSLLSVSALLATTSVAWSLAGVVAGEAVCGGYLFLSAMRILARETRSTAPQQAVRSDLR
jgi:O-antigen/teichoic acid export membrane protein